MNDEQRAHQCIDLGLKISRDIAEVVKRNTTMMMAVNMHPKDSVMAIVIGVEAYRAFLISRDPSVADMSRELGGIIVEASAELSKERRTSDD